MTLQVAIVLSAEAETTPLFPGSSASDHTAPLCASPISCSISPVATEKSCNTPDLVPTSTVRPACKKRAESP